MLDTLHILTLLRLPKIGRKTVSTIIREHSFQPQVDRDILRLVEEANCRNKRVRVPSMQDINNAVVEAEHILESSKRSGIVILSMSHSEFPNRLTRISDPPVLLFIKGDPKCLNSERSVAIIGTREPTDYGMKCGLAISKRFAQKGFVIVSGLAKGCDTAGHMGCLEANGKTIAILGHGLHTVYPAANKNLAEKIVQSGGCLVSEYPVGVNPRSNYFIERDRLQSGLSSMLVVIETGVRGGTMYAVNSALKEGKPIGCLSHPLDFDKHPKTEGNRDLITNGKAEPLSNAEDIDNFIRKHLDRSSMISTQSFHDEEISKRLSKKQGNNQLHLFDE